MIYIQTEKIPLYIFTIALFFILTLLGLQGIDSAVAANRERETCKLLGKEEGRNLFAQDPIKYKSLDGDHDGKACE